MEPDVMMCFCKGMRQLQRVWVSSSLDTKDMSNVFCVSNFEKLLCGGFGSGRVVVRFPIWKNEEKGLGRRKEYGEDTSL